MFTPSVSAQISRCGSDHDLETLKKSNPKAYQEYLKIQKHTQEYINKVKQNGGNFRLVDENGIITIPVVVHVVHRPGEAVGTGTNISDAQIQSQIDVLNEDFQRLNADIVNTRTEWLGVANNPQFMFKFACAAPDGSLTNGITRIASPTASTTYSSFSDNIKSVATGGQNPWPTNRYLNVWVAPALNALGYAQFPFQYSSSPNTDGVVVVFNAFGRGFSNLDPSYNQGRTLTHEIGHWLDLFHTFEGGCNGTDECADTPQQQSPNYGCPTFPKLSCNNGPDGDMFQNYMDYSDDNCMNLFTRDQVLRMRAVFQPGGVRRGFIDNYFNITAAQPEFDCGDGGPISVMTPFCTDNNVNWTHTGPIRPYLPSNNVRSPIYEVIGDGEATISATWGNYTDTEVFAVGVGAIKGTLSGTSVFPAPAIRFVTQNTTVRFNVANSAASGTPTVVANVSPNVSWSQSGNDIFITFPRLRGFTTASASFTITTNNNCGALTSTYNFISTGSIIPYSFRVSPNPASDYVTITAEQVAIPDGETSKEKEKPLKYDVIIYDQLNRPIKQMKNMEGLGEKQIDISNLPAARHYNIQIVTENDAVVHKIFKN